MTVCHFFTQVFAFLLNSIRSFELQGLGSRGSLVERQNLMKLNKVLATPGMQHHQKKDKFAGNPGSLLNVSPIFTLIQALVWFPQVPEKTV